MQKAHNINFFIGKILLLRRLILKLTTTSIICWATAVPGFAQQVNCPPAPSYALESQLPILQPGDYWIYTVTGTLSLPASGSTPAVTLPLSGTFVENVQTLDFQGSPTLALVTVQNLTAAGASIYGQQPAPQSIFYIQQDPTTLNVNVIGDNGGPNGATRVASQPQAFYPGKWNAGTSYNNTLSWTSGGTTQILLTTTGTTTVSTPIGDFAAWVAPTGATDSVAGVVNSGTDEWSPQLGAPVSFQTGTTLPTGQVTHLNATLAKTNRAPSLFQVVADKLNDPRGLAFDRDGALWATEAGTTSSGPCIPFMTTVNCFGNTGRVDRIGVDGLKPVLSNIASLSTPLGDQVSGVSGITFSKGKPYILVGDGGPQSVVNMLGSLQDQLGIVSALQHPRGTATSQPIASLAQFEYQNNPDNRPNPDGTLTPESNPYGLTSIGSTLYAAEGGAHTVLSITPDGSISVVGIIPAQSVDQPAAPGAPTPTQVDSVPTGIIPAPDGHGLLVADYSGYPYFPGTSRIWRVNAGQDPQVYAGGMTNLIGLAPSPDGVYALELASNGFNTGDPEGAVVDVSQQGAQQTQLVCRGLVWPTGIVNGPSGDIYVSNYGLIPGYGEIDRIHLTGGSPTQ